MLKISVIIPVYNVAKYLPECLDSVLEQTFNEIEVIAVDDGSTDDSGKILEEYAAKDNRLKVIHQKNAGVSAARNAGLDIATGDYICFVDGDDYLDRNAFTELSAEIAHTPETDIFVFGFKNVLKGKVLPCNSYHTKLKEATSQCFSKKNFIWNLGNSSCGKLFKRDFLNTHQLRFAKGVPLAEDGTFCIECVMFNPSVKFVAKDYYVYRIFRENSTMVSEYELDKEILCWDYIKTQPFYLNASREDKLIIDIKVCGGLLYRYSLLSEGKRRKNLHYLEEYKNYLDNEYSKEELTKIVQYEQLLSQIKCKGKERLSFWQQIFSIKNTRDKMYKDICILGLHFRLKRTLA